MLAKSSYVAKPNYVLALIKLQTCVRYLGYEPARERLRQQLLE